MLSYSHQMPDSPSSAQQVWDGIAEAHDADLIAYFGPVQSPHDRELLALLESRRLRKSVILWLATFGGDADAAYRISRTLQWHYRTTVDSGTDRGTFIVFVDTMCKSAGTIIVLGSDRLILSDYAELGPIDPQIRKPDGGSERSSALTPMQSLNALQSSSFELFRYYFRQLRFNASWNLTTKTASEVAATMTIGLMGPIYSQIDPIRLGEIDRFTKVALRYGQALDNGNLKEDAVERLVAYYPSHSFVIDRREARELFQNVDEPDFSFRQLSRSRSLTETHMVGDSALVMFLNSPLPEASPPPPPSPEAGTDEPPGEVPSPGSPPASN